MNMSVGASFHLAQQPGKYVGYTGSVQLLVALYSFFYYHSMQYWH